MLADERIDVAAAKRDLDDNGYAILEGVLDAGELAAVRGRLVEQADQEREEGWALAYDDQSQAVVNLLSKGAVFADLVQSAPVLALLERLLGPELLLSSITSNIIGPGTKAQLLHGDQRLVPDPWLIPMVANVAWILDDFTETNGATRIVPGSHVHGRNPDPDNPPAAVPVIAKAGSAMVFDGRLWHGAGENRSDNKRHVIFAYYCAPWIRQQENMFLGLDPVLVEAFSPRLKALLGYTPYLGKIGVIPRQGVRTTMTPVTPTWRK
jgi:ectoine hydroxylase-related dioxygenase (phytanoyl-CoA dioxygenase family)